MYEFMYAHYQRFLSLQSCRLSYKSYLNDLRYLLPVGTQFNNFLQQRSAGILSTWPCRTRRFVCVVSEAFENILKSKASVLLSLCFIKVQVFAWRRIRPRKHNYSDSSNQKSDFYRLGTLSFL